MPYYVENRYLLLPQLPKDTPLIYQYIYWIIDSMSPGPLTATKSRYSTRAHATKIPL